MPPAAHPLTLTLVPPPTPRVGVESRGPGTGTRGEDARGNASPLTFSLRGDLTGMSFAYLEAEICPEDWRADE
jgi:hypothetical protein